MTTTPTTRLEELERLLREATPGPWDRSQEGFAIGAAILIGKDRPYVSRPEDADLIVFLRNHAEDLLAVCRATEQWIEAYNAENVDCEAAAKALADAALARLTSPTGEEGS